MEAVRRNKAIKTGNSTSNSNTFDSSKIKSDIDNNDVNTQPNPNERNVYWEKKIRNRFSHNNNNSSLTDIGNHQNSDKRGIRNCSDSKLLSAERPAKTDKLNEIKCYNNNCNRNTNPSVFKSNNSYQRSFHENKSNHNNYNKNNKTFPKLLPTETAGSSTIVNNLNITHNNQTYFNFKSNANFEHNYDSQSFPKEHTAEIVLPATAVEFNENANNLDMQWICAYCNYWNMNEEICKKCAKLHDSSDLHKLLNEIIKVCPAVVLERLRFKVNNEWLCRICNNLNSAIKVCQKCNKPLDRFDAFVTLEFVASLKYLSAGVELRQAKTTSCNSTKLINNTNNSTNTNTNDSTNINTNNSTNTNTNNSTNSNTNNSTNTNTNNSTNANTNNNNTKIEVKLDVSNTTTSTSVSTKFDDIVLLTNNSKFDCIICLNECAPTKGIFLHKCFHSYCRGCATKLIMKSCSSIIKCSDINENGIRCEGTFQPKEIEALLCKKRYDKFRKRCLAEVEMTLANTIHCNTTNCIGFTIMEIGDTNYVCEICHKLNCIPCKAIHESLSCEEYKKTNKSKEIGETEKKLQLLIETGDAMVCPMCDIYLSKSEGCDGMSCSYCGTEICWITKQARWGSKGRGDISGGCRCNVNNIKCHVLCDTCH